MLAMDTVCGLKAPASGTDEDAVLILVDLDLAVLEDHRDVVPLVRKGLGVAGICRRQIVLEATRRDVVPDVQLPVFVTRVQEDNHRLVAAGLRVEVELDGELIGQVGVALHAGRHLGVVALGEDERRFAVHLVDDALTRQQRPVRRELAVGVAAEVVLEHDVVAWNEVVVLIRLEVLGEGHCWSQHQDERAKCQ